MESAAIEKGYSSARERYARLEVDTDRALDTLRACALSLHSRRPGQGGRAPGAVEALREDLHQAFALVPGRHRLVLDALAAEPGGPALERNALEPAHFRGWLEWAKREGHRLDFRAACYGHPMAGSGFTLSHREKDVRKFWIEHVRRCRKISAFLGRELKAPCLHTLWVPDGAAAAAFDRWAHRELLLESLDEIYEPEHSPSQMRDALESRPLPDGDEALRVASYEFMMGYAMNRNKLVGLDLGRLDAAGPAADKVSAVLQFSDEVILFVSRSVPWDDARADILDAGMPALAREIVRGGALSRVRISLDDAGTSRVGSWTAAARATLMALLVGLLEPEARVRELEARGDEAGLRALAAELEALPYRSVWDYHCLRAGVPPSGRWRQAISDHEKRSSRGV